MKMRYIFYIAILTIALVSASGCNDAKKQDINSSINSSVTPSIDNFTIMQHATPAPLTVLKVEPTTFSTPQITPTPTPLPSVIPTPLPLPPLPPTP